MSRTFTNKAPSVSATRPRGRGRGARMDGTAGTNRAGPEGRVSSQPGLGEAGAEQQNQRMETRGAYTVVSPNEKKRNQVAAVAKKETDAYNKYKESRKTTYCDYVGTVAGNSSDLKTETSVRNRQQQNQTSSRLHMQQRSQQYRAEQKNREQKQYDEKKAHARRQSETNVERESARQNRLRQEHRRKNEAFLRNLEKGNKS